MHDQLCVLLEFTNESGKVAVGYQDWLQTKTEETWDDIVKNGSELTFRWPNCDVGPMASMKKKIKTCKWKSHVAKVLAVGGWTKMCEFRTNLENFGILNPSKADRKLLTTKTDAHESDVKSRKRKLGASVVLVDPDCEDDPDPKSVKTKKLLRSLEEQRKHKICKDPEEESSEDDLSNTKPKDLLTKISVLQAENEMLRADVARLRTMQAVKGDLPTMMQLSQSILDNLKIIEKSTNGLTLREPLLLEHNKNIDEVIFSDRVINNSDQDKLEDLGPDEKPNNQIKLLDHNDNASSFVKKQVPPINKSIHEPNPVDKITSATQQLTSGNKSIHQPKPVDKITGGSQQLTPSDKSIHEPKPVYKITDGSQQLTPSDKSIHEPKPVDNVISRLSENNIKVETMDLGGTGVMVPAASIQKCNHSSFSKLTCEILAILFTKDELANSSLTGTVSNLHLKKGTPAKMKLDPSKVQAVKAYVLSHFPLVQNAEELFKNTVKQKCNNALRRGGKSSGKSEVVPATLNTAAPAVIESR